MPTIIGFQNASNDNVPKLLLAVIVSKAPHHPSPNGTGINAVCTESDSMAEILWEIVHTISQTASAPKSFKII